MNRYTTRLAWIGSLLFLICSAWFLGFCIADQIESYDDQEKTIFVSVASYRDQDCLATVRDMFDKAAKPERVVVGICEQNAADPNESCLPTNFKWNSNVRRLTIPHKEAKGPCYARYLCSTLYRGETYYMQIDSHTTFVPQWDEKVIKEHGDTPNPHKAVLTGYPHDSSNHGLDEQSVPILCDAKFNDAGIPQLYAGVKTKEQVDAAQGKHFVVPFTSGGFIFGPGHMVKDVPYDPALDHVFQGEEILYSARLWTHGYDFYTPRLNLIFHKYGRKGEKRWHDDVPEWHDVQVKSMARLKRLLGLDGNPPATGDPHGLGTVRTIQAYWEFAGLDPKRRTTRTKEKFC